MTVKRTNRQGITLIEVLSAIAVASIGVFGVLVLVPLASRMSQIGFSNEAARSNSSNVLAKAKSFGALDYSRWSYYDQTPLTAPAPRDTLPFVEDPSSRPVNAVCVDPLLLSGVAANNVFPMTSVNAGVFDPTTDGGDSVFMERVTIARNKTLPVDRMGSAVAKEFLSEGNSIRLVDAVADESYPMQRFIDDPGNGRIKREITSSKSSILLLLPTQSTASLIYRAMALTIDGRQVNTFDRVFDVVNQPPPMGDGSAVIRSNYGTLDLRFAEYDFDPTVTVGDNLPSGGWVILVPYQIIGGQRVADWKSAISYEILSSDQITADGRTMDVTLTGPTFTVPTMIDPVSGNPVQPPTQAIYVPGTVDIHEMEVRLGVE